MSYPQPKVLHCPNATKQNKIKCERCSLKLHHSELEVLETVSSKSSSSPSSDPQNFPSVLVIFVKNLLLFFSCSLYFSCLRSILPNLDLMACFSLTRYVKDGLFPALDGPSNVLFPDGPQPQAGRPVPPCHRFGERYT